MNRSSIEWTDVTWNPVTGCNKVSAGCKNCYAERMAERLQSMGSPRYANGFQVTLHEHVIDKPRTWKRPRKIFVNSMSDLFHEAVPMDFIERVFDTMFSTPQHIYQILTKRSERLRQVAHLLDWPENVWIGVSVESPKVAHRIDDLREVRTPHRFLSCEPLLGSLAGVNLTGIAWVIAGGESGPHARPMDPMWPRELRDKCHHADIPFFFKQWGGTNKAATGRLLDGAFHDAFPQGMNDTQYIVSPLEKGHKTI